MDAATIARAIHRHGVIDLAELGTNPARAAARAGLVVVQRGAAVAATQPVGPLQQMYAVPFAVAEPFALLSSAALWAHGQGPLPTVIEVGVELTRGLTLTRPVVPRSPRCGRSSYDVAFRWSRSRWPLSSGAAASPMQKP